MLDEDYIEVIPNRLYWISSPKIPKSKPNSYYICTDEILTYTPLNLDFGPLNLSLLYNFCKRLKLILQDPLYEYQRIYYYTSQDFKEKANSAFLICGFQLIILRKSLVEIIQKFASVNLTPFRDAGEGNCEHSCTLIHCLNSLQRAMRLK